MGCIQEKYGTLSWESYKTEEIWSKSLHMWWTALNIFLLKCIYQHNTTISNILMVMWKQYQLFNEAEQVQELKHKLKSLVTVLFDV